MSDAQREQQDADDLRKPGWLPTAILVNILPPKERRNNVEIDSDDLVRVEDGDSVSILHLPSDFSGSSWRPAAFEVGGEHGIN